jgi:hypothetical protein
MTTSVKTLAGISNVRDLRSNLLTAAYEYVEFKTETSLILKYCKLSPDRLNEERRLFAMLVPEAAKHINILAQDGDSEIKISQDIHSIPARSKRSPGVGPYNVQNIMLLNWMEGRGYQTIKAIGESCGTSYPTTATVIKALTDQGLLNVRKDRSVELKYFPVNQWRTWIASGSDSRKSARFIDISGQPLRPSSLIKRLKLNLPEREDIAISGIEGARFHYPDLDLSGSLRLDLVLHGNHKADLSFVKMIDPGLKLTDNPFANADLVVHFMDRPETHFVLHGDLLIADPLECLADLYDMKLDQQADQMLYFLSARKKKENNA